MYKYSGPVCLGSRENGFDVEWSVIIEREGVDEMIVQHARGGVQGVDDEKSLSFDGLPAVRKVLGLCNLKSGLESRKVLHLGEVGERGPVNDVAIGSGQD